MRPMPSPLCPPSPAETADGEGPFLDGSKVSPVKIGSPYSTRDSGGVGAAIFLVSLLLLAPNDGSFAKGTRMRNSGCGMEMDLRMSARNDATFHRRFAHFSRKKHTIAGQPREMLIYIYRV